MKTDEDGQTFKQMVGESVLAPDFQVFDDPTLTSYAGKKLNGYYKFDDQGVRAKRVNVVVDGKLHDFLMTRVPLDGFPALTGMPVPVMGLILFPDNLIYLSRRNCLKQKRSYVRCWLKR